MEILASNEERERTCALLQEACVAGRLSLDELTERVRLTHMARTREQLQQVVADLPVIPAGPRRNRIPVSSIVAVMSSSDRRGPWRIGERCQVRVVAGSCKLDLREAIISDQITTFDVRVIAGSLEIIVPEGVMVEPDIATIAASKSVRLTASDTAPGEPVIHIVGAIIAGSLKVRDRPRLGERIRETVSRMIDQGEG